MLAATSRLYVERTQSGGHLLFARDVVMAPTGSETVLNGKPFRLVMAMDSTGERNSLRLTEEWLHEAETSDLLLR